MFPILLSVCIPVVASADLSFTHIADREPAALLQAVMQRDELRNYDPSFTFMQAVMQRDELRKDDPPFVPRNFPEPSAQQDVVDAFEHNNPGAPGEGEPQIPRILHRVMLPTANGDVQCHGKFWEWSGGWSDISDMMLEMRDQFYQHNERWEEFVWGKDAIKLLFEKSGKLFEQEGLRDFVTLFNSMDEWMYQQDTIRHLILYHFGGVYMDLDMNCSADLFDIVGNQPLVVRAQGKTNFLAAAPHQEFSFKMLERIGDTFREGLADKQSDRPSAIKLTGEKQICNTLYDDFGVNCGNATLTGNVISNANISLKLAGGYEVENWSKEAKCSHNSLSSWTNADSGAPKAPMTETEIAAGCPAVYDDRTTWGSDLISKIEELQ